MSVALKKPDVNVYPEPHDGDGRQDLINLIASTLRPLLPSDPKKIKRKEELFPRCFEQAVRKHEISFADEGAKGDCKDRVWQELETRPYEKGIDMNPGLPQLAGHWSNTPIPEPAQKPTCGGPTLEELAELEDVLAGHLHAIAARDELNRKVQAGEIILHHDPSVPPEHYPPDGGDD